MNLICQASVKELEDQLMGVKIREADTLAELKEMRQKVGDSFFDFDINNGNNIE